jgi:sulfonate transport system permease protein
MVNSNATGSTTSILGRLAPLAVLISPVLLILVWWGVTRAEIFPQEILVPPAGVVAAFRELLESGELQDHLARSLGRLAFGFVAGTTLGIAFGVLMGMFKVVDEYCSPLFNGIRQVPTIAFIPMFILIFGIEETFKIVIVAKAAFFPVALAAYESVKGIPRSYFEVAAVYKVPTWTLVHRIIVPATVPPILTGLRISLSRAWIVLVAAELLAADSGVGQMMEWGRQMFRMDIVMVGVFITGIIGFALDRGFKLLEQRQVRWKSR